jgi:hypothetical protein
MLDLFYARFVRCVLPLDLLAMSPEALIPRGRKLTCYPVYRLSKYSARSSNQLGARRVHIGLCVFRPQSTLDLRQLPLLGPTVALRRNLA